MNAAFQKQINEALPDAERATLLARLLRDSAALVPTTEAGNTGITEYVRFMMLKARNNDVDARLLSPSGPIDVIWHAHILDTRAYASFCARLFGEPRLLHHNPDFADETAAQAERYRATYARLDKDAKLRAVWWPAPAADTRESRGSKRARDDASAPVRAPKRPRRPHKLPVMRPTFAFTVRLLTGKVVDLSMPCDAPLSDLFDRLQAREGIPTDQVLLIINKQRRCVDHDADVTLIEAGVTEGGVVHGILRLSGC